MKLVPTEHLDLVRLRFILGVKMTALNQFVASQLGLNVTDLECLEVAYFDEVQPVTPSRLSKLMGLSPGSITTSLKKLERAGLITRETDPTDGRRILLRFIPGSRAAINACFEPINRHLADFDGALGSEERESIKKYFSRLLEIIDDYLAGNQNLRKN